MSKILDGLKKVGSFVSGVKKFASIADKLNDDLDKDGKMELENIKEDFVATEDFLAKLAKKYVAKFKALLPEVKQDFGDLATQVKLTMARVDKLIAHLKSDE